MHPITTAPPHKPLPAPDMLHARRPASTSSPAHTPNTPAESRSRRHPQPFTFPLSMIALCSAFRLGSFCVAPEVAHATKPADAVALTHYYAAPCGGGSWGFWYAAHYFWEPALTDHNVSCAFTNYYIYWKELTDDYWGGQDKVKYNIDSVDIAFLATHGSVFWLPIGCELTHTCTPYHFRAQLADSTGAPGGTCLAKSSYMNIGNNDAEFLDILACYSNEPDFLGHLQQHAYRLHQWHGFYGVSNTMVMENLDDYIDDAFDDAAAVAWVENTTRMDAWGPGTRDICATAFVKGDNWDDAVERAWNETYATYPYYGDPYGTSPVYLYWCGCHPNHVNDRPIGGC